MSGTIETERLLLRPWKVDDAAEAESLFRYASDPEIGLLCGWPPHKSAEGSMNDIKNILAVENNWAIAIKDDGNEPVGSIALKPVSHYTIDPVEADDALRERYGKYLGDNAMELGYWIGRPFWGRGYMPEALDAVLGYAFGALHKDAVWGGHYKENAQSGRVMVKCGMRMIFESQHDYFGLIGEYHDDIFRIITADEWKLEHKTTVYASNLALKMSEEAE
ncbi:GNAT family N-acetyltransferase [Bifidobacterium felsineum]|uniref:GNAT family N-acetyltransferase n=1 Tax=Bifidobacterium felsineum TaxID=2045440 RepID=A0A2M9HKQ3_9BIFI|nr:GNAT family N-acetyltransferase [Bifidobacterium felsineum]MBT1163580.1 GNAT family N-acetyltransferase [Bifidobacterium felsineum]PJM77388.1 GNAT family N-acetyltransferase [Bifidobacterium felsineum]